MIFGIPIAIAIALAIALAAIGIRLRARRPDTAARLTATGVIIIGIIATLVMMIWLQDSQTSNPGPVDREGGRPGAPRR